MARLLLRYQTKQFDSIELLSISPSIGPAAGGTQITGLGRGFAATDVVRMNGVLCPGFIFDSTAQVRFNSPAISLTNPCSITITRLNGEASTLTNCWTYAPLLTSINPIRGPVAGGTAIVATGKGFINGVGLFAVFGFTQQPGVTWVSFSQVNFTSASEAGNGDANPNNVWIQNPDTQGSNQVTFTYDPSLTSVTPNSGDNVGGTPVVLGGEGFVTGCTIAFDGLAATAVVFVSAKVVNCTTPAHAALGAVNVVITNPNGQASTLVGGYTYVATDLAAETNDALITEASDNIILEY